ncbi:unnamed protein product [[Candida] boidinii]|nr:unnamed protein product [[Candida] boidinii]
MLLLLLKVTVLKVLLTDGVLRNYQERPIEVLEKLPVLVLGIHLTSNGLLPELVKEVTTTEPLLTTRFSELVKLVMKLLVLPITIELRKLLLQWVVSLDTVTLTTISYY